MMDSNEMAENNHSLPSCSTYVHKEATGDHHPTISALIIKGFKHISSVPDSGLFIQA